MRILVETRLATHWKVRRLALLLEDKNAIAYVLRLWLWAFENATNGRLDGFTAAELVAVMEWEGEPRRLISALVKAGFLDARPLRIHDWGDWNGAYRKRYDKAKLRNQRWRDRIKRERESKEYAHLRAADASRDASRAHFGRMPSGEARPDPARPGPSDPPPPSSSSLPASPAGGGGPAAQLWEAYPVKKRRRDHYGAFVAALDALELRGAEEIAAVRAELERRKKSADWLREGGRFVPKPENFLARDLPEWLREHRRAVARSAEVAQPSRRPRKSKSPTTNGKITVHAPGVWPDEAQLERDGVKPGRAVRS